jgi:soluble lytic murein transglycosylase-like protein
VFARKWKLTALGALAALAAAGSTVAVTAVAQTAAPRGPHAQAPTFRSLERAATLVRQVAAKERARKAQESAPASPETYGVSQATLDAIAQCESGGDPTAVSADGTYRGLYQFDEGTWQSVGGTGDPAAASPAEQTMRAAMLYARSGSSPWPVCGV